VKIPFAFLKRNLGWVLAIGLPLGIFLILFGAELGMLTGGGGELPRHCELKLPKWFGCALANHEGLAGGLIGASGALYAAWWAADAVWKQVQITAVQTAISAKQYLLEGLRQAEISERRMREASEATFAIEPMMKHLSQLDEAAGALKEAIEKTWNERVQLERIQELTFRARKAIDSLCLVIKAALHSAAVDDARDSSGLVTNFHNAEAATRELLQGMYGEVHDIRETIRSTNSMISRHFGQK
jgi:hypothetical protein